MHCSQASVHLKGSIFHTNFKAVICKKSGGLAYPDQFGPLGALSSCLQPSTPWSQRGVRGGDMPDITSRS